MTPGQITASLLQRSTTRESTGSKGRYLRALPSESTVPEVRHPPEIPAEAHRILQIWAEWKHAEGGAVTLGYPRKSAGLECVGPRGDDAFDHRVEAADRRTGAISEAILDDMDDRGHGRQVLAIWNRYFCDVARFRGNPELVLIDGCRAFLVEARRRGIAV